MKVVIFAGGLGTRLSEETTLIPKPLVRIGSIPILHHIMKFYQKHGHSEFIICGGYKFEKIIEYFWGLYHHGNSIEFDFEKKKIRRIDEGDLDFKVSVIDTGINTLTGGRLSRVRSLLGGEDFLLTYGDGLTNVDITKEIQAHHLSDKLVTLLAVKPPERFGNLELTDMGLVAGFNEKKSYQFNRNYINGGYFVCRNSIFEYLHDDSEEFEKILEILAVEKQLNAFRHTGFWQPMDTLYEKNKLNQMILDGDIPWL